jgi:hypothetical protein
MAQLQYYPYNESTTIYRQNSEHLPIKSLSAIKEECKLIEGLYTINAKASAPPKPWYYENPYKYAYEVIIKVHEVHKYHWNFLPFEWQKYYLDYYTYKFQRNEL